MTDETITLKVKLRKNQYNDEFDGIVFIRDGVALSMFSDKSVAKAIYHVEKAKRNKNAFYDKDKNAYIEKYPNLTAEQIKTKLMIELKNAGGRLTDGI